MPLIPGSLNDYWRLVISPFRFQIEFLKTILLWVFLAGIVGIIAGSTSALFLMALDFVTEMRQQHPDLLYLLPLAGVLIAGIYKFYGKNSEAGTNLVIEEIHEPQKTLPLRMAPLVLFGTLLTHLCGGSAGREGTAVQMAASLSDQGHHLFKMNSNQRTILIMSGISAGFASVFGTPIAGAIFGMEVLSIGRVRYQSFLPCFVSAIVADLVCAGWGIKHPLYKITDTPLLGLAPLLWSVLAGVVFGLCAYAFANSVHHLTRFLKGTLQNPMVRAFCGGLAVIALTLWVGTDRYLGLGIPVIQESFLISVSSSDFMLKFLFTVITLSSGFKGGEVTPLFFIGACLGSALAWILPLPVSLLAGMGFVAIFSGAANTPLACIFMSFELFGAAPGVFTAVACVFSYLVSGHRGIYHSQKIEVHKYGSKN